MKRQTVNPSPGAVTGGKLVPSSHKRRVNLDTLSSDSSEEEIRDSGSSFHSLIVGAVHTCDKILMTMLEILISFQGD